MSSSFDLPSVDRLTTGTIGPAGGRVFYLQARAGAQLVSLKVEKEQVAALAAYLADQLADLPGNAPTDVPTDLELEEPVIAEWAVGSLALSYDEQADRLLLVAEELVPVDPDDPDDPGDPVGGVDAAVARFGITRAQIAGFVARAASVVAAGRPPCPFCGRPMNAEGHVCAKSNGHGRA